ncbi:MAG: patatin-like phospholipase family protein [Myxococcales bacterium]
MAWKKDGLTQILSLDGGPGPLAHLYVLEHLETQLARQGRSVIENVDVFAGTSDGALVSLFLAWELSAKRRQQTKRTPLQIVQAAIAFSNEYVTAMGAQTKALAKGLLVLANTLELLMAAGKPRGTRRKFVRDKLQQLYRHARGALLAPADLWAMRRFFLGRSPYVDGRGLHRVLQKHFGDARLKDLDPHVVVLSFDSQEWSPRAFRNFGAKDGRGKRDLTRDVDLTLVEVGMSTAALPIVMPVFPGQSDHGYLDGIFAVNNPVMSGTSLVLRHLKPALDDLRILSLGVEQTREEKLIERAGGLTALLTLLAVDDRDARMFFGDMTLGDRIAYLFDPDARAKIQRHFQQQPVGLGDARWGWADYFTRPTLLFNLFVHGTDRESWRQCQRLVGAHQTAQAHRFRLRINVVRAMWRLLVQQQSVQGTDLPWNAARSFGADPKDALSADERDNRDRARQLEQWIQKNWFDPSKRAKPAATRKATATSPKQTKRTTRLAGLRRSG